MMGMPPGMPPMGAQDAFNQMAQGMMGGGAGIGVPQGGMGGPQGGMNVPPPQAATTASSFDIERILSVIRNSSSNVTPQADTRVESVSLISSSLAEILITKSLLFKF